MGRFPVFAAPALFAFGLAGAVTLVEKSNGLQFPEREAGHTELEVADIDLDGHLDIISVGDHGNPYVNSDEHGIMVWINDGSDSFALYQTGEFGYGGCAVGDLDLDGLPDLAWGIHHDYAPAGQIGDKLMGAALGDGTGWGWTQWDTGLASGGEDWGMFATDLADFDLDGDLDIVCESFGSGNGVRVYENNRDGTWSPAWSLTGGNANYTIETGDFNGDGFPDFVCTRWFPNVSAFLGDGAFGFTPVSAGIPDLQLVSVDAGDADGDGRDDILCSLGSDSGVHCFRLDTGTGQWQDFSTGLPSTGYFDMVQMGDIDGDGFQDAVAYADPSGQVFLGDGSGGWTADASWTMPAPGSASAMRVEGDTDHDGREDIVVQAEMAGGMFDRNQLKLFSPWLEPSSFSTRVVRMNGGETLVAGSVTEIRWATAVPPAQPDASVDIYLSVTGSAGPWTQVASGTQDDGHYQWTVESPVSSDECRIRIVAGNGAASDEDVSDADFTIILDPTGVEEGGAPGASAIVAGTSPNPCRGVPTLTVELAPQQEAVARLYSIEGRLVGESAPFAVPCSGPVPGGIAEDLPPGLYMLEIVSGKATVVLELLLL